MRPALLAAKARADSSWPLKGRVAVANDAEDGDHSNRPDRATQNRMDTLLCPLPTRRRGRDARPHPSPDVTPKLQNYERKQASLGDLPVPENLNLPLLNGARRRPQTGWRVGRWGSGDDAVASQVPTLTATIPRTTSAPDTCGPRRGCAPVEGWGNGGQGQGNADAHRSPTPDSLRRCTGSTQKRRRLSRIEGAHSHSPRG